MDDLARSEPKRWDRAGQSRDAARAAATLAATATALPPHRIGRDEVKTWLERVFPLEGARLEAMLAVVDHSQVKQRWCIHPIEEIVRPRALEELNREYARHAVQLGRQVAGECLDRAGMRAADVDLLVTVSCTGVMIPSLDAHLANDLGFRADVRRLPITELGCAAGAAALARAADFLRAWPGATALVVAVELPSLTFQRGDTSQANLISSILFGDGAAAALVTGREAAGPRIAASESFLFPRTLGAMGFDLASDGFHIVLSRDVPELVRAEVRGLVDRFLAREGLRRDELAAWILHPGGQKLLAFMEEELGLAAGDTACSWHVLREYGNQSSASVLFVLHEWLARRTAPPGAHGVLAAFGPGFSAELLLLSWPPALQHSGVPAPVAGARA
jgi:alkylresorcinol/alkylpyrone synthase